MSDEELIKETMMLDYSQLVMHNVYMIKENKRLHSIIKEIREYIENNSSGDLKVTFGNDILEILDKENKNEVVSLEELESYEPQNEYEQMEQDYLWKD